MTSRALFFVRETTGPEREAPAGRDPRVRRARHPLRFPLGQIVATPAALEELERCRANPVEYLARHATGDWGELDAEDRAANERAVESEERILSAYTLTGAVNLWIITEADRSVTTILLPSDY
jgi:hypothetical protein